MNRVHLYLSENSYWILQELKVKLICKTYNQLFNKLRELIIGGQDIQSIQSTEISTNHVSAQIDQQSYSTEFRELDSRDLPTFMRDNPWLEILSRRGKDYHDFKKPDNKRLVELEAYVKQLEEFIKKFRSERNELASSISLNCDVIH